MIHFHVSVIVMTKTIRAEMLKDVDGFFSELGIRYFIGKAICLSIIRSGTLRGISQADNQDLDIYILKEEQPKYFKRKFAKAGWTNRYGKLGCQKGKAKDFEFYAWKNYGDFTCVIDGCFLMKYKSYRWNVLQSKYQLYDSYLFDEPERVTVEDATVSLPNPPEEYLNQEFGNWREPKDVELWDFPSVIRAIDFDLHSKLKARGQAFKHFSPNFAGKP